MDTENIPTPWTLSLVKIRDNGGETFDRYFAIFEWDSEDESDTSGLSIGPTGNAPNGVCMSAGSDEFVDGDHLGPVIWEGQLQDMTEHGGSPIDEAVKELPVPEPVQRAIRNEFAIADDIFRQAR